MPRLETLVLGRSRSLTLHDIRCSETARAPGDEEEEPFYSVMVPMSGVYVQDTAGLALVGAPGVALFWNPGDVQRTAHPAGRGDRTIELILSADAAEPFTAVPTGTFRERMVPVSPLVDLEFRSLSRAAARGDVTSLELDERGHELIDGLFARTATPRLTDRQRTTVDRALEYLAWHFADDADLPTVAASVGYSPHHLSRVFHAGTGITLSGYRTQLRVRAALERIEHGADDLSAVASDVGSFDHAHMTRTFRRLLDRTPTGTRTALRDPENDA
jgi:AraC family transcriptional regulator